MDEGKKIFARKLTSVRKKNYKEGGKIGQEGVMEGGEKFSEGSECLTASSA